MLSPQWALTAHLAAVVGAKVIHYPPAQTRLNNLDFALNGSGTPGIFNSSETPDEVYGIYNWCNMPHVRAREYKVAPEEYTLVYVHVIQRHHKRTPYASNTFFKEDIAWDCPQSGPVAYATSPDSEVVPIQWNTYRDAQNPWTTSTGPGFVHSNCQFPQITPQGLQDSHTHGSDLRSVYVDLVHFIEPVYDPNHVQIRVTNNVITSQVAGALVQGLFPQLNGPVQVHIQPTGLDSLEPQYPCPNANTVRNGDTSQTNWTDHLNRASALYDRLDGVSGIERKDSAGWHTNFDHYYDNMSAKQCHDKSLPCNVNDTNVCVSQTDADTVYRLGNWEYSYLYRDAPGSATYGALKMGGWMLELVSHLETKVNGTDSVRYRHHIGHDGSLSSLLALLQIEEMVWPGMGSEVVFELYQDSKKRHLIRVLWSGQPLKTSTPLGTLDLIPLDSFLSYVKSMVGTAEELVASCRG